MKLLGGILILVVGLLFLASYLLYQPESMGYIVGYAGVASVGVLQIVFGVID